MKDHIPPEKKWGIYQINCEKIYIGKIKRDLKKTQAKNRNICKPVLLKLVSKKQELTNRENIVIKNNKDHIINV